MTQVSTDKKETAAETTQEPVQEQAEAAAAEVNAAGETGQPAAERKDKKEEKKAAKKKEADRAAALESEMAVLNDKYLRVCAEYDNFRRRSQKEKDNLYGDIKAETVQQFLPVYDNLERALRQSTEDEAYRKGVEMIMNQFVSTLEKLGVSPIECLGQPFDPALHNAVMHVDDEEKGENEIVEVFQKGFLLGDKVIRFAMVKVAN